MAVWAIDLKVQIMIDIDKKMHDYATASLASKHIIANNESSCSQASVIIKGSCCGGSNTVLLGQK